MRLSCVGRRLLVLCGLAFEPRSFDHQGRLLRQFPLGRCLPLADHCPEYAFGNGMSTAEGTLSPTARCGVTFLWGVGYKS
jgi:hypothetical protein